MEASVSNVEVCNFAYTGQFDKLKQCILTDKTLACKTDQVWICYVRHYNIKQNFINKPTLYYMRLTVPKLSSLLGGNCSCFIKGVSLFPQDHRTALHWACSAGHTDIVGFLLDLGVEVNLQDDVNYSRQCYTSYRDICTIMYVVC